MNKKSLIVALFANKLMDSSIDTVCSKLSKQLGASENKIKKMLHELEKEEKLQIRNGFVYSGGSNKKSNTQYNQNTDNLVLGVIQHDNGGYYYFKPSANFLEEIPLAATEQVKNAVGKRCCCDVSKIGNSFSAELKQVFGEIDDPISENIAIAYKYGFNKRFSPEVIAEVANVPQNVLATDLYGRTDMRDVNFITIDPATCKDKDDAIYAEKTHFGYRVYVAIADVSHYVKKGTELDKEAFRRGTSCYLGSGVYPMLPPELSNGICSLNENVDRLALVCTVDINNNGKIQKFNFEKAVINVKKSYSYEEAEAVWLNKLPATEQEQQNLNVLYEITDVLEGKLSRRGSLNFLSYEPEFVFNREKNQVEDVKNKSDERSHKVVEEFMILANEATSKFFKQYMVDGIYRIHDAPRDSKIKIANQILNSFGVFETLSKDNISYQNILNNIKNLPCKEYLNSVVMQTMNKAKYSAVNTGHFGLGSTGYTHFTSPIRRYSDTIAHRIISEVLEYGKSTENHQHLTYITEHLNTQELKATKAEKDSDRYLCCLWAEKHMGEVLNGYVSRVEDAQILVRHNGVVVQIPTYLMPHNNNSAFVLTNDMQTLKDRYGNASYTVGDYVNFKIAQVDKSNYSIYATTNLELKKEEQEDLTLKF